jgi:ribulose-5-phosphate 4-epimerase/fuculose-1-phosphate aldolase
MNNINLAAPPGARARAGAKIESILPDRQAGFVTPQQPSLEEERLSRKQRLAAAYRIFGRFRFDMGGAGHITARDPELTDHFWVNPFGVHFTKIRVSDLMLVSDRGDIVQPPARVKPWLNQAAFAIHSRLHQARPDVNAAAHSHSLYGKAFSSLGRMLEPISQDAAAFYENHALFDDFTGVVLDTSEGDRIAGALGDKPAVILKNHGLLTVGGSVEAALWRYLAMENACQTQLLAEAAGAIQPMAPDVARLTRSQIGDECTAYCCFQPYWEWICAEEPDFLD